jgi:hypothetical protein
MSRSDAIEYILGSIFKRRANITMKFVPQVSSLIVLLVWMANALANRPEDGGTWNEVRDSGSVHRTKENGEVEAYRPLGCYMLHSLVRTPTYRISGLRTIEVPSILRLASTKRHTLKSMTDLYLMLNTIGESSLGKRAASFVEWGDEPAGVLIPGRTGRSNKQRRNIDMAPDAPAPAVFGSQPAQIAIPGFDEQEEEGCTSEEDDDEEREQGTVTYEELSELLHRVAVQIFSKVPNHTSGDSYCRLSEAKKLDITNDVFMTRSTLATTWRAYTLFTDSGKWEKTVQRLFPTRLEYNEMTHNRDGGEIKVQGLHGMEFWRTWQTILHRVTPQLEKAIVRAMRARVNSTWGWFPAIEGGKLFNTGKKAKGHYGDWPTGPWIACNPRFQS